MKRALVVGCLKTDPICKTLINALELVSCKVLHIDCGSQFRFSVTNRDVFAQGHFLNSRFDLVFNRWLNFPVDVRDEGDRRFASSQWAAAIVSFFKSIGGRQFNRPRVGNLLGSPLDGNLVRMELSRYGLPVAQSRVIYSFDDLRDTLSRWNSIATKHEDGRVAIYSNPEGLNSEESPFLYPSFACNVKGKLVSVIFMNEYAESIECESPASDERAIRLAIKAAKSLGIRCGVARLLLNEGELCVLHVLPFIPASNRPEINAFISEAVIEMVKGGA